jgi:ubiquinone/menaquinone biosynthesis C-methylase UbiE
MTTNPNIEQFKEMIRLEWTDANTVAAWRKWYPQFAVWLREATEIIVEAAQVRPGMHVLDIASGTGEPALTLAERVGPLGQVTASDLGPEMIAIAEENARSRRFSNMKFQQADVHNLPFADEAFDVITCRFGVMYFADPARALSEIARVLKPGGRVALTAWAPLEQNEFLVIPFMPFLKRANVPPPPPGAPHPFRYAQAGSLSSELSAAGFREVSERTCALTLMFPGRPEENWQHLYETAAPFHPIINSLSPQGREQAVAEVLEAYRRCYDGKQVKTSGTMVLATAAR